MTEKELIAKIKEFKQISPKKDWVILTKTRILGEQKEVSIFEIFPGIIFGRKSALAGAAAFAILFALFSFAQSSVSGDLLFSVKRIAERGQAVFVSEADRPQASLELANRRLEELTRVAQTNQVNKLAPALNEFQASVSEAAKSLSKIEATSSDPIAVKNIVNQTKKLEGKMQEIKLLGIVIGDEEIDELRKEVSSLEVKLMISDLEKMTLSKAQEEILSQMKGLAQEGKYSEALELFLAEFNQTGEEELIEEEEENETDKIEEQEEDEVGKETEEKTEEKMQ